jgi:hypothetical protein
MAEENPIVLSTPADEAVPDVQTDRLRQGSRGDAIVSGDNGAPAHAGSVKEALPPVLAALLVGGFPSTPLFPRNDGIITDFTTGRGGPARSAAGCQFSLLSDSAWNLDSRV